MAVEGLREANFLYLAFLHFHHKKENALFFIQAKDDRMWYTRWGCDLNTWIFLSLPREGPDLVTKRQGAI